MWLLLAACLLIAPAILANPIDEFELESDTSCSKAEKEKAPEDVGDCGKKAMAESDQPFCKRVDHFINRCTDQHLRRCFNTTYIRLFKDSMIVIMSNLFKQTGKSDLFNECEVAKEYFDSKRSVFRSSATCTPEQVQDAANTGQECGQRKAAAFKRKIAQSKSVLEIQQLLCQFAEEVIVDCQSVFRECYNDEEMKEIRKTYYKAVMKLFNYLKEDLGGLQELYLERCLKNLEINSGSS